MNGNDLIEKQKAREDIVAEIHSKFPDVKWPKPILEPIFYGRLDKTPVAGRKLMLDKNTNNQFDIVSDQYKLIYHEEVLFNLLNALPEEFGDPTITAKMFKYGARAHFTALFPELNKFEIKGSETNVEYRLKNSYDRSTYLNYSAGAKELVCSNGLRVFKAKEQNGAKHIGRTISTFNLESRLRNSLGDISEAHKLWLQWAEMKLKAVDVISVVENLPYSEKEQETLLALPIINHGNATLKDMKDEATLWSVMSAGTQMVHEIKSEERRFDIEEKLPKIIGNAAVKLAA